VDAWTWAATYTDGSTVAEGDDASLDLQRVAVFELRPQRGGLGSFSVLINQGETPFFVRTRATAWLMGGGEAETLQHVLGLGLADGTTVYITCDEQGHAVISSERLA
jgi:hypothetical protein